MAMLRKLCEVAPSLSSSSSVNGSIKLQSKACLFLPRSHFQVRSFSAQFDGETAAVYGKLVEVHNNPGGPWKMMTDYAASQLKGPSYKILDLATGPGEPGTLLAKQYPDSTITLSDVSEDMLKQASKRSEGLANVIVKQADMQDLPFDSNHFDLITSCYGYMFPPDKEKAFSETYRVLKKGGSVCLTYWSEVELMMVSKVVMTAILGEAPPPPPINPLSLREPGLVPKYLTAAGFTSIEESTSTYDFDLGDPEFAYKAVTIPIKPKLDELIEAGKGAMIERGKPAFMEEMQKRNLLNEHGQVILKGNKFIMAVAKK